MKKEDIYLYSNTVIISLLISLSISLSAYPLTLYKWTDENGVTHYSDKVPEKGTNAEILKLPKRPRQDDEEIIIEEESVYATDEAQAEQEILDEEIRLYWRNLALTIENKKERTLEEIFITERKIDILNRNIDYYLIHGYKADHMILDLRFLEAQLPPLYARLEAIEEEKKQLRKEARKQGIPPGYLRP